MHLATCAGKHVPYCSIDVSFELVVLSQGTLVSQDALNNIKEVG